MGSANKTLELEEVIQLKRLAVEELELDVKILELQNRMKILKGSKYFFNLFIFLFITNSLFL